MFISSFIVFSSRSFGVDQTFRHGVNCASTQKDKFALVVVCCRSISLQKKKTKKKNKNVSGARALARFSSSLVFFFSVSFATTRRAKAQRRRGRESFKKKFSLLLNLLQI